jgi:tRNA G18 (ribose-2'-O)-methylase SpoU
MIPLATVTVLLDNVRSLYNVGAVMRACDGAGVRRLIACGITPYPFLGRDDPRRGPVAARADRELRKTALAAYETVRVEHCPCVEAAIAQVRGEGATVVAVERVRNGGQAEAEHRKKARTYWQSPALDAPRLALVLGHEVEGVAPRALDLADAIVEIPMLGAGTSLNVTVATALVLYEILRRRMKE